MDITLPQAVIVFIGFVGCCYVCRAMWNYATRDDVDYYYPPDDDPYWKHQGNLGEDSDDEWK